MASWIRRWSSEQKIAGSSLARIIEGRPKAGEIARWKAEVRKTGINWGSRKKKGMNRGEGKGGIYGGEGGGSGRGEGEGGQRNKDLHPQPVSPGAPITLHLFRPVWDLNP